MVVHRLSSLRCQEEMAGSIAIKGTKQSWLLNHCAQAGHDCASRFFGHQLRVVDLAGGVVRDHYRVMPAIVTEPTVLTPSTVQQHLRRRPPRSSSPTPPALAP